MKTKKILLTLIFSIITVVVAACDSSANGDELGETTHPTPEQIEGAREVQADLRQRLTGILEDISPDFYPWVPVRGHGEHISSYSITVRINISAHCILSEAVDLNGLYTDMFAVIRQVIDDRDLIVRHITIRTTVGYKLSLFISTWDHDRFAFGVDDYDIFDEPRLLASFPAYRLPEVEFVNLFADYFSMARIAERALYF